jgi:hypothetical protein
MPRARSTASPSAVVGALAASTTAWGVGGGDPGCGGRGQGAVCLAGGVPVGAASPGGGTLRMQRHPAAPRALHCSVGATRPVMTPPMAAGTSTSQGMVRNSGGAGWGGGGVQAAGLVRRSGRCWLVGAARQPPASDTVCGRRPRRPPPLQRAHGSRWAAACRRQSPTGCRPCGPRAGRAGGGGWGIAPQAGNVAAASAARAVAPRKAPRCSIPTPGAPHL